MACLNESNDRRITFLLSYSAFGSNSDSTVLPGENKMKRLKFIYARVPEVKFFFHTPK